MIKGTHHKESSKKLLSISLTKRDKKYWRLQQREYRKKNQDKYNAYMRTYNKENKEILKGTYLKRKYGIDLNQYNQLVIHQNGVCAICGNPETIEHKRGTKLRRVLAVDHDHKTGKVRGLLCQKCNQGIGLLRSPDFMRRAIEYISKHE